MSQHLGVLTPCPYKGRCGKGQRRYGRVKHFLAGSNTTRRRKIDMLPGQRLECQFPASYLYDSHPGLTKLSGLILPH